MDWKVFLGAVIFFFALFGFIAIVTNIWRSLHMQFKKKKDKKLTCDESLMEEVKRVDKMYEEIKAKEPVEEWIWVDGYKGTDKDMKCRDYQYVLGELHNMPNDAKIEECESGFHLCKDLNDVFKYYDIGNNNRFFKVRALVRKADYERLGEETEDYKEYQKNPYRWMISHPNRYYDKMAARSIIFERELTPDEILENRIDVNAWTEDAKKRALSVGINLAYKHMQADELVKLGYSEAFALLIINADKFEIAKSVATQPDLSMDMKCWMIFK